MVGRPAPNAEPGTGTQKHAYATPHDVDDGKPCVRVINGRKWKVGHDYIDTERADVCTLVEVVGFSSWCSTRPADESPEKLIMEYEKLGGTAKIDPHTPEGTEERFLERAEGVAEGRARDNDVYPW